MAKTPREIRNLKNEIKDQISMKSELNDMEKKNLDISSSILKVMDKQMKIAGELTKSEKDLSNAASSILKHGRSYNTLLKGFYVLKGKILGYDNKAAKLTLDIGKSMFKSWNIAKGMVKTKNKILKVTKQIADASKKAGLGDAISTLDDDLAGGIGKKIKKFITSPMALIGAGVVATGVAFKRWSEVTDQLGEKFGYLAKSNTEIQARMLQINKEGAALDINSSNIMESASTIAKDMGLGAIASLDMAFESAKIAKTMGITDENAVSMADAMMNIAGLSVDQYKSMTKQVAAMAKMNGLVPASIMEDVATSAEFIADYTKDGAKNIYQAAINAKKFGLNLSTVTKIADSLLDFETSITAEFEASAMIGKQLNFNSARRLALEGKTDEAVRSVVDQLGGASEFAELDVLQRRSLAGAIGITTVELSKFMNKQDQVNNMAEVTGEALEKQKIDEIVPESALSNLQLAQNYGKNFADTIIPAMNTQMEIFNNLAEKSLKTLEAASAKMNEMGGTGMSNAMGGIAKISMKITGLGTAIAKGVMSSSTYAAKAMGFIVKSGKKSTAFIAAKGAQLFTKGALKASAQALKKIPVLGSLAAFGMAAYRGFGQGDWKGAGMEAASGGLNLLNLVPGLQGTGSAASLLMDGAILARDLGAFGGGTGGETLGDGYITKEGVTHKFSNMDDVLMFQSNRMGGGGGGASGMGGMSDETIGKLADAIGKAIPQSEQKVVVTRDDLQYVLQSRGY